VNHTRKTMTLDQLCSMTLDQLCDGGSYPSPEDVRQGTSTGLPATTGTLNLPATSDVRAGVSYDNGSKTGTLSGPVLVLSPQSTP
jgi:hypothetical protein